MTGGGEGGAPPQNSAGPRVEVVGDGPGELCALAERVARTAGSLVERGRRDEQIVVAATKSSPTDVVTQMDRAAEELIRGLLGRARPEDALLGEESGGGRRRGGGLTWVVDPIDGTVNYLYGLPAYAVSVAAVRGDPLRVGGWSPLVGCVHNPVSGETWTAIEGQGARLDGVRLPVRSAPPLDRALIGTGFGYLPEHRRAQGRLVAELLPRVRDIRRIGSAALDLCAVASGRLDGYYESGLNPWDMAAGWLVVTEAGGVVLGPGGEAPSSELVVAGFQPLADHLLPLVDGA